MRLRRLIVPRKGHALPRLSKAVVQRGIACLVGVVRPGQGSPRVRLVTPLALFVAPVTPGDTRMLAISELADST